MPNFTPFLKTNNWGDKSTKSPSDKSYSASSDAIRELIRRALQGKIEPEAYFQAVQLIREHGDFNLGSLFRTINQIEDAEESEKTKVYSMPKGGR